MDEVVEQRSCCLQTLLTEKVSEHRNLQSSPDIVSRARMHRKVLRRWHKNESNEIERVLTTINLSFSASSSSLVLQ